MKRKSEDPESNPRPKTARTEQDEVSSRPAAAAPSSRFQLTTKSGTSQKPPRILQSPAAKPNISSNLPKTVQSSIAKPSAGTTPTPPSTANGAPPQKRGFASIMEKAKAAQEAAKEGSSGIKHKPVEKLTKRERLRMIEEAKAQKKATKSGKAMPADRSRSGTPVAGKAGLPKKGQEASHQSPMKKRAEPLAYRGTMKAMGIGAAKNKEKKKGLGQDKYGGYASWSELSDAEEEEEPDYDSEGLSDMEGGFDDVEQEEMSALRTARKEDQEALEEEERHRKEKSERKRRLEELSKSAAARKKY